MLVICQFSAARCTFESNQCGWTNTDKDNFDWKRKQGSTPSIGTGPSVDHTLGTKKGYFVYIETSFGRIGDRARFLSPLFKKVCIFFYWKRIEDSARCDMYILYFRIPHNTLCLPHPPPHQILHKPLILNAPGSIAFSQEHFKTISYAKFGGQTECIMGDSKIVNTWENIASFFIGSIMTRFCRWWLHW